MRSYNLITQYNGWTSDRRYQIVYSQSKSPRIGGKLQFSQNNLDFRKEHSSYSRMFFERQFSDGTWEPYFDGTSSFLSNYNGKMSYDYDIAESGANRSVYYDEAMVKALHKAGSFQANLLDMYRTRQETIDSCTKMIRRFDSAYRCLRARNWPGFCGALGISARRPRRGFDNVPGLWLEYVYAWRPLVQDVYAIINHPFPEPYKIVHGRTRGEITDSQNVNLGANNYWHHRDRIFTFSAHTRFRVRTTGAALAAASQLGVTNPLSLAWEALPYSFVVDWFYDVGGYLENLTALSGLILDQGSQTLHVDCVINRQHGVNGPSNRGSGHSTSEVRYTSRNVVSPSYPTPRLRSPLSLGHTANALSLLSQAFSHRR